MGLRDIIAHEYHRIDAEEIYLVIKKRYTCSFECNTTNEKRFGT